MKPRHLDAARRGAPARAAVLLALALLSLSACAPLPPTTPARAATAATAATAASAVDEDPYLWLEEVHGERALAWVRERHAQARAQLAAQPAYPALRDGLRRVLDTSERIPAVTRHGDWLYNVWRDAQHPRGLWRRTTLAEYRRPQPAWETVLDLDALARAEGENWVWGTAQCLPPAHRRCLIGLSRGGADARVVREFDTVLKAFVPGGFSVPEAKTTFAWLDNDTVLVATDVGPGSLSAAGYPRQLRRWQRGQALGAATPVFEAAPGDVGVDAQVHPLPGGPRVVLTRYEHRYAQHRFLLLPDGRLQPIALPADARLQLAGARLLVQLRSDWSPAPGQTHPRGALLVTDFDAFQRGERQFTRLFAPTATRSLAGVEATASQVLLNVLDEVSGRLEAWRPTPQGWQHRTIATPAPGTLVLQALHDPLRADDPLGEQFLLTHSGFLNPDTLYLADARSDALQPLKSLPALFDATGARVEQHFARSKDGTRVPYFVVWPAGARADGDNPTLLYGYGGFEVSQRPRYLPGYGVGWTARGGVLVIANIRGGGEYGPAWHQAAIKANKQKSYDDFIAVAEDLIARRVTRAARLGIEGGSNGGLLVGAVMLQRPELFNAVVSRVPLLDMKRYHRLLAGASWMAEYGDPDQPADWAVIARYSPYQNVRPGMKLPPLLLTTSTRDDRVHPGHARKMAARMLAQGHAPLYLENTEGGHGGAADNAQRAELLALSYAFLWQQLGR